ncbi:hypothetical protein AYO42_03030 [Rhizomicrobium sp. SCGC AG-212-E05]|nr:hypothetical protein AYO42_03030 [Rhizomicrobium sp. SCGC AG-212-E05]
MKLLQTTCAGIALLALANPALAAACATPGEAAALKTAVMHQAMMVAALQCKEVNAYNRFIKTYRGELQSSDAALKGFFVRRGGERGEAGYDSFKTKAANISGLEQARDTKGFCADARALFAASALNAGSLASFVEARSAGMDIGAICKDSRPVMVKASPRPPMPQEAVAVAAAPLVKMPEVKMAEARPVADDISIGGVPQHRLAANPYRRPLPAPEPQVEEELEEDDIAPSYAAAEAEDLPPPRPRAYQIRERPRDYGEDAYGYRDSGYRDRGYGPPRGWQWRDYPPPRPRWYRGYDY